MRQNIVRVGIAALWLVSACTVDETGEGEGDDSADEGGDEYETLCSVSPSYADLPSQRAIQRNQPGSQGLLKVTILDSVLNDDELFDAIQVQLYDARGVFADGAVAPGTYTIEGAETDQFTCGVCVEMWGDIDPATGVASKFYVASAGTVTVESVSGTLTGSVEDVVFTEVDQGFGIDDCESELVSAPFSAEITVVEGGGGGGGGGDGSGDGTGGG